MINIAGLTRIDDPSYRYKMPQLILKVEGKGNGIKTGLVNIADIGTALNRDATEMTKYFGYELGTQTTASAADDRFVVNGARSLTDMEMFMAKYIEGFVICGHCRLPETCYKIKKQMVSQKCMACGSKTECDPNHRLSTFIEKNYKRPSDEKKKDKKAAKKAAKKTLTQAENDTKKDAIAADR